MDAEIPSPDDIDVDSAGDVLPGLDPGEVEPSAVGSALTWVGSLLGAVAAKKVLERVWVSVTGEDPPTNPAAAGTRWRDALLWGAALGLAGGLARTVARRATAGAASRLTGEEVAELA